MAFASCALIFLTASTRSLRASGTAASAARFIATTSSSTCSAYPMRRASLSARARESGSGILTRGLPRKPSVLPSAATAACVPRSSAVRRPASASRCVTSANWARAGTAKVRASPATIALLMKATIIAPAGALAALLAFTLSGRAPDVHLQPELRGEVVLVNFWATYCASCLHEMPELVETHKRCAARGLETLAVAVHQDDPGR